MPTAGTAVAPPAGSCRPHGQVIHRTLRVGGRRDDRAAVVLEDLHPVRDVGAAGNAARTARIAPLLTPFPRLSRLSYT
jgi:hypothetical protein